MFNTTAKKYLKLEIKKTKLLFKQAKKNKDIHSIVLWSNKVKSLENELNKLYV